MPALPDGQSGRFLNFFCKILLKYVFFGVFVCLIFEGIKKSEVVPDSRSRLVRGPGRRRADLGEGTWSNHRKSMFKLFKKTDALGQFEQLCLTAVVLLRDNAYGIPIHEKVEELGERRVLLPAVYVTLERLEEKGYLTSSFTDPTPERGGRSKRMFQLTSAGERALKESAATAQRIYESLRAAKWKRV